MSLYYKLLNTSDVVKYKSRDQSRREHLRMSNATWIIRSCPGKTTGDPLSIHAKLCYCERITRATDRFCSGREKRWCISKQKQHSLQQKDGSYAFPSQELFIRPFRTSTYKQKPCNWIHFIEAPQFPTRRNSNLAIRQWIESTGEVLHDVLDACKESSRYFHKQP